MMTLYSPYGKSDSVTIKSDKIISMVEPKEEILKSYQQNIQWTIFKSPGLMTENKVSEVIMITVYFIRGEEKISFPS